MSKDIGSAFDLVPKSYELVKKHWKLFAIANVLSIASGLATLVKGSPEATNDQAAIFESLSGTGIGSGYQIGALIGVGAIALVITLLIVAFSVFLYALQTSLELRASKNETPSLDTLIEDAKRTWLNQFIVAFLSGVIIVIGLILLIVPGIIAIHRLIFAPYLLIQNNLSPIDALKASNELAKKNSGKVWGLLGVLVLTAFGAGIVSAIPNVGEILSAVIIIALSLLIPLRLLQLTGSSHSNKTSHKSPAAS